MWLGPFLILFMCALRGCHTQSLTIAQDTGAYATDSITLNIAATGTTDPIVLKRDGINAYSQFSPETSLTAGRFVDDGYLLNSDGVAPLDPGTAYQYVVTDATTATATLKACTKPEAPTGVNVQATGKDTVTVYFSDNNDNGLAAYQFNVYDGSTLKGSTTGELRETELGITGLTAFTEYTFSVTSNIDCSASGDGSVLLESDKTDAKHCNHFIVLGR